MKILCFISDFDGGGAQRSMINLVGGFHAAGASVSLIAGRTNGPALRWLHEGTVVEDLGCRKIRDALFPLARLITRKKPDVILSTMVDANIVAFAATRLARRHRPVTVLRETNSHEQRTDLGALRRGLVGVCYRGADAVVALSSGVREELIRLYGVHRANAVTIHNPIDLEVMHKTATTFREQPPMASKIAPLIVAIGRLTHQKGFDRILRSVARLDGSWTLAILGEGEDRQQLELQAKQLGIEDRVLMPGFVSDPIQWLVHADVFVLPSRWEGFGHVVVEAMAAGTPVVAFDCPHGPRDIIEHGESGLLAEADNENDLTTAIHRVLHDSTFARRLVSRAYASIDRFSIARISRDYFEVFERLLDSRKS